MRKSLTRLLAILATLVMTISVVAGESPITSDALPEIDASISYSNESNDEEPDCSLNCDLPIGFDDSDDY